MITTQAKRIRDALKAIGLKHGRARNGGDFVVRTEGSGTSAAGWGDAYAVIFGRQAEQTVVDNAQRLVDMGCDVCVHTINGRHHPSVASSYKPSLRFMDLDAIHGNWLGRVPPPTRCGCTKT